MRGQGADCRTLALVAIGGEKARNWAELGLES